MDRGGPEAQRIRLRLSTVASEAVYASIISFEEQIRGWASVIARTQLVTRQLTYYRELERLLKFYCVTPMLAFDHRAATEFERLRPLVPRLGTMDLKIASIALAKDATLLTRNLSDFGKIPDLRAEDWSA